MYVTALFTGLRHGELRKICWSDVDLEQGRLIVREEIGKARRADEIPLHPMVIDVLSELQTQRTGSRVFSSVPTLNTFKKDCGRAGINIEDKTGRTVDFHSFRMTLATWLQKAGVHASYAQRILRHASFKTTDKYYTDLRINDLTVAINELDISESVAGLEVQVLGRTGTDDQLGGKCHQNCHQSGHQAIHQDASICDENGTHGTAVGNEKPRQEAGLCNTVQDRAGKRVRRFERPTFTLAT